MKTPEYILRGVRVGPDGQPISPKEEAPILTGQALTAELHSFPTDVAGPSQGEIAQLAAKDAPAPEDFETEEEYEVARASHEQEVATQETEVRRSEADLAIDPATGLVKNKSQAKATTKK